MWRGGVNIFPYGNKIPPFFIIFYVDVSPENTKVSSRAMEMQEWVPFVLPKYCVLLVTTIPKNEMCSYSCLGTQNIKRIFSAQLILLSVACLAIRNFSKLSHKRHDFRTKKISEYKTCVLIACPNSVRNISHSKKKSARYHNCTHVFT